MNRIFTNLQKQQLGEYIGRGGYTPGDFTLNEDVAKDGTQLVELCHRESANTFTIQLRPNSLYVALLSVPGTDKKVTTSVMSWTEMLERAGRWVNDLKHENEAIDPWAEETEGMADDDSLFTVDELPRVDKAIDESLAELKQMALEAGKSQAQIEADISEIKLLLKKTARSSTKKEWINLFKSIVVGKLVDWGMKTVLFHTVLQTLMTSAHDIVQLAEHAARHLPG